MWDLRLILFYWTFAGAVLFGATQLLITDEQASGGEYR